MFNQVHEGVEHGDLKRLVQPVMSIDEFRSKMGEDKDIIVIGLTVLSKDPADDLVNFVEKSYDWVLDADVSSGETSDGNYMVFIELQRKPDAAKHIYNMLTDMMNLTKQSLKDWTFTYYKGDDRLPVTEENLTKKIIASTEEYELKTSNNLEESIALNNLKASAGIKIVPKSIKDKDLLAIQVAAGIR